MFKVSALYLYQITSVNQQLSSIEYIEFKHLVSAVKSSATKLEIKSCESGSQIRNSETKGERLSAESEYSANNLQPVRCLRAMSSELLWILLVYWLKKVGNFNKSVNFFWLYLPLLCWGLLTVNEVFTYEFWQSFLGAS